MALDMRSPKFVILSVSRHELISYLDCRNRSTFTDDSQTHIPSPGRPHLQTPLCHCPVSTTTAPSRLHPCYLDSSLHSLPWAHVTGSPCISLLPISSWIPRRIPVRASPWSLPSQAILNTAARAISSKEKCLCSNPPRGTCHLDAGHL